MKTARNILRKLAWVWIAIFVISLGPAVTKTWAQADDQKFRHEELVQMLAPIALYPDSLVADILMASTYPLEVVEAERWLRDNTELKGDALYEALRDKSWDPSVKALCNFPDVLLAMSDKLDQTRKLGDAFLVQEDEVMATVQELRQKAEEQGNLKSTEEQKVIVEREVIRIEPASPEVVYVPVYDPYYVYGPWWYPDYPPYYWYYPRHPFVSGVYFGFGPPIYIGFDVFSWVWFDWRVHQIFIDVPRTYRFQRYQGRPSHERYYWRHDPSHRRGVAYRDRRTGEHFGVPAQRQQASRPETRGYPASTVQRNAPAPAITAPAPGRNRKSPVTQKNRPAQPRIQAAPSQRTSQPPPALKRERSITPERERDQQRAAPVQRRENVSPSTQAPSLERNITPQRRPETQRIQPVPRRVAPPPSAVERIPAQAATPVEPARIPSSGRETTFQGINNGSFESRAGQRGAESRGGSQSRRQNEGGRSQDNESRGRGGKSRR